MSSKLITKSRIIKLITKKKSVNLLSNSIPTKKLFIRFLFVKYLLVLFCLSAHAVDEKQQAEKSTNYQKNTNALIELESYKNNNNTVTSQNESKKNTDDLLNDVDMIENLARKLKADNLLSDALASNADATNIPVKQPPILINNDTLKTKQKNLSELSTTSIETVIQNSEANTKINDGTEIDSIQSLSNYQAAKYSNSFDEKITAHPMPVGRKTSGFGYRRIFSRSQFHKGVDFAAKYGTPIYAAGAGKVVISGWLRGYGRVVYIDHGDGLQTRYAHNSKLLVRKGQQVKAGQQISKMGCSGRCTGPHLHFEIRKNGKAKNPMKYLKGL